MKTLLYTLIAISSYSYSISYAADHACPEKTPKEWAEYFIARSSDMRSNSSTIQEMWSYCEPTFRLNGVQACAEKIVKVAKQSDMTSYNGYSMGWEVEDDDYISSAPEGYLDLPKELKDGLPDDIREIAKEKGWEVLQYESRTVPNPPNRSFGRTLLMIPGEKVDKWIQFTSDNSRGKGQLIDFIAMEKPTDPEDQATPYFTQYMRDSNGQNPKMRTHFDNCYSCHPGGMRELSPKPGSYSAADKPVLDSMQERMRAYTAGRGGVDWGGKLHPEDYGPPMGEKQGCVKCHNNGSGRHEFSRGAINSRHDTGHIQHKMTADFSMPVSMTPIEQEFLQFVEDIPLQLTEEERKQFQSMADDYESSIDAMLSLGKITQDEAHKWKFVVNGHPDYENCKFDATVPDCFRGMKRYKKLYDEMLSEYPDQKRAWLVEDCEKILSDEIDHTVNDSNRNGNSEYEGNSSDDESGDPIR